MICAPQMAFERRENLQHMTGGSHISGIMKTDLFFIINWRGKKNTFHFTNANVSLLLAASARNNCTRVGEILLKESGAPSTINYVRM